MATRLILCGNTKENIHDTYEKYEKEFLMLKDGVSKSNLASKVGLSTEAIQELITKDLLKLEDDEYKPTFPILVGEDKKLLDQVVREALAKISGLTKKVDELKGYLKEKGWEDHLLPIFFSVILDDQAWDFFYSKGLIAPIWRKPRKTWNGYLWATEERAGFSCGTNNYCSGEYRYRLAVNWTYPLIELMRETSFSKLLWEHEDKVFKALAGKGESQTVEKLQQHGLLNERGKIIIPILRRSELSYLRQRFTKPIAQEVVAALDISLLEQRLSLNSSSAFCIAYHELMWMILDELVDEGMISLPEEKRLSPHEVGKRTLLIEEWIVIRVIGSLIKWQLAKAKERIKRIFGKTKGVSTFEGRIHGSSPLPGLHK